MASKEVIADATGARMSKLNDPPLQAAAAAAAEAASFQFYAVRKSQDLQKPAIFFSWEDCCRFVTESDYNKENHHQCFDDILDAFQYLAAEAQQSTTCTQTTALAAQGSTQPVGKDNKELSPRKVKAARILPNANTLLPSAKEASRRSSLDSGRTTDTAPPPILQPKVNRKRKSLDDTTAAQASDTDAINLAGAREWLMKYGESKPSNDVNNELGAEWLEQYEMLLEYKKIHGDCNVTNSKLTPENKSLGRWVVHQRTCHRKVREGKQTTMNPARIRALRDIGFEFTRREKGPTWEGRFEQLVAFKERFGHCHVHKEAKNPTVPEKLSLWLQYQRHEYQLFIKGEKAGITKERIQKLSTLGVVWRYYRKPDKYSWEDRYQQLVAYQKQHGNCNVMLKCTNPEFLGQWVSYQRRLYKTRKEGVKNEILTQERINRLESIGFQWKTKNRRTKRETAESRTAESQSERAGDRLPAT